MTSKNWHILVLKQQQDKKRRNESGDADKRRVLNHSSFFRQASNGPNFGVQPFRKVGADSVKHDRDISSRTHRVSNRVFLLRNLFLEVRRATLAALDSL